MPPSCRLIKLAPNWIGPKFALSAAATAEGIGVSNVGGKSVGGIRVGDAVAVGTGSEVAVGRGWGVSVGGSGVAVTVG